MSTPASDLSDWNFEDFLNELIEEEMLTGASVLSYDREQLPSPLALPWDLDGFDWGFEEARLDLNYANQVAPFTSSSCNAAEVMTWPETWQDEPTTTTSSITISPLLLQSTIDSRSDRHLLWRAASPQTSRCNGDESSASSCISGKTARSCQRVRALHMRRRRLQPAPAVERVLTRAGRLRRKKLILLDGPVLILPSRTRRGSYLR